jgi:hypothetical protein
VRQRSTTYTVGPRQDPTSHQLRDRLQGLCAGVPARHHPRCDPCGQRARRHGGQRRPHRPPMGGRARMPLGRSRPRTRAERGDTPRGCLRRAQASGPAPVRRWSRTCRRCARPSSTRPSPRPAPARARRSSATPPATAPPCSSPVQPNCSAPPSAGALPTITNRGEPCRGKWLYRACASMSTPQPISTPQPESASVPIAALSTSG